jgi:hypothetical protein
VPPLFFGDFVRHSLVQGNSDKVHIGIDATNLLSWHYEPLVAILLKALRSPHSTPKANLL